MLTAISPDLVNNNCFLYWSFDSFCHLTAPSIQNIFPGNAEHNSHTLCVLYSPVMATLKVQ